MPLYRCPYCDRGIWDPVDPVQQARPGLEGPRTVKCKGCGQIVALTNPCSREEEEAYLKEHTEIGEKGG